MAHEASTKGPAAHAAALAIAGLPELLDETSGDPDLLIAILDGPVDRSHAAFGGIALECHSSLASCGAARGEATHHGTFIAGVIVGRRDVGGVGLAPGCRALTLPIFGETGTVAQTYSVNELARAIEQAVNAGARIINISAGQASERAGDTRQLERALQYARDHNALVIAAAGNRGCACTDLPAAHPTVLAVGAVDPAGRILDLSNHGRTYQANGLVAPGTVIGPCPGGGTIVLSGTSVAAAIVSGCIALLLSVLKKRGVEPSAAQLQRVLIHTTNPCGALGEAQCRRLLAGHINLSRALAQFEGEDMADHHNQQETTTPAASSAMPSQEPNAPLERQTAPGQPMVLQTVSTAPPLQLSPHAAPSMPVPAAELLPSACACETPGNGGGGGGAGNVGGGGGGAQSSPPLVYALGQLGFDYRSEALQDSLTQSDTAFEQPWLPSQLLGHLDRHPENAYLITWTLNIDSTPIYALAGFGPYAPLFYERVRSYLASQLNPDAQIDRTSIPAYQVGNTTLSSGQTVPTLAVDIRGMYRWSTEALVETAGMSAEDDAEEFTNFLNRIYHELRNRGATDEQRALNYAATNAFQAAEVFLKTYRQALVLESISAAPSTICRPNSNCWDVNLSFFNPVDRLSGKRIQAAYTIDVSEVIPVTIGKVRYWNLR